MTALRYLPLTTFVAVRDHRHDARIPSVILHEKYVVDADGRRISVVLDVEEFRRLLEYLEGLEDTVAYDHALAETDEAISFDQATAEIENGRIPR